MQPHAPTEARLFDGVRARPRSGSVHLLDDTLVFRGEGPGTADELRWNLAAIRSIRRVARELHVEIGGAGDGGSDDGERGDGVGDPVADGAESAGGPQAHRAPLKLVVSDPAFEAQLDAARAQFLLGAHVGLSARLRRFGVRTWLLIAVIAIPIAWIGYTVALPHAHVFISMEAEAALGEKLVAVLIEDWDVVDDEAFAGLCAEMVAELRDPDAGFDIRVTLVDEEEPNAFAAPGGRIVVFSGLLRLCPSPDALAGVLAHEIVHVEERHGLKHLLRSFGLLFFAGNLVGGGVEEFATAEAIAELSSGLLILRHSRAHEREADALAIGKLQRAGRSAAGLREFFIALEKRMPELSDSGLAWLATHPLTAERIAAAERLGGAGDAAARPWIAPEAWATLRERLLR